MSSTVASIRTVPECFGTVTKATYYSIENTTITFVNLRELQIKATSSFFPGVIYFLILSSRDVLHDLQKSIFLVRYSLENCITNKSFLPIYIVNH